MLVKLADHVWFLLSWYALLGSICAHFAQQLFELAIASTLSEIVFPVLHFFQNKYQLLRMQVPVEIVLYDVLALSSRIYMSTQGCQML